jgi:hypothetical protein
MSPSSVVVCVIEEVIVDVFIPEVEDISVVSVVLKHPINKKEIRARLTKIIILLNISSPFGNI